MTCGLLIRELSNSFGRTSVHLYPAVVPTGEQRGACVSEDYVLVRRNALDDPHALGLGFIERVVVDVSAVVARMRAALEQHLDDGVARALLLHVFEQRVMPLRLLPHATECYLHPSQPLARSRSMAGLHWACAAAAHHLRPVPKLKALRLLSRLLPRLQPGLFDGPIPDISRR